MRNPKSAFIRISVFVGLLASVGLVPAVAFGLRGSAEGTQQEQEALQTPKGTVYSVIPDYVYGHKEGLALTFDVLKPETANGLGICFMVSGGWNSRWYPPEPVGQQSLFASMLDSGYTVFLIRHGSAPRFKVPEAVADVRQAVARIKEDAEKLGIDPDRLGVCGGSAGGHLSTMLGTTGEANQRCAVVACYFPPTDLRPYVTNPDSVRDFPALDFDKELAGDVSPALHASDDDAPTLLVHGDRDRLVPLSHSEHLKKELDKVQVPCQLIVIKGAAHGFAGKDQQRAEAAVLNWFDTHLKSETPSETESKQK